MDRYYDPKSATWVFPDNSGDIRTNEMVEDAYEEWAERFNILRKKMTKPGGDDG